MIWATNYKAKIKRWPKKFNGFKKVQKSQPLLLYEILAYQSCKQGPAASWAHFTSKAQQQAFEPIIHMSFYLRLFEPCKRINQFMHQLPAHVFNVPSSCSSLTALHMFLQAIQGTSRCKPAHRDYLMHAMISQPFYVFSSFIFPQNCFQPLLL